MAKDPSYIPVLDNGVKVGFSVNELAAAIPIRTTFPQGVHPLPAHARTFVSSS